MAIGSAPVGMQLQIAFERGARDVLAAPQRLRAQGIQPLSFFGEPADEPSVIGWMPATAMYFRDPDGHMLEYLTMLERPPRPELGVVDWSQRPSDPSSKPPPGPPNPTPSITPIWLLVAKSQECAAIC